MQGALDERIDRNWKFGLGEGWIGRNADFFVISGSDERQNSCFYQK
jgi:hypothetical protein